jgi:hypothetical protein
MGVFKKCIGRLARHNQPLCHIPRSNADHHKNKYNRHRPAAHKTFHQHAKTSQNDIIVVYRKTEIVQKPQNSLAEK